MKTIKLKDILSISGKGGLYKFIAQARNGVVVESLDDQKRHVASATARVSSLEDIAIFTEEEEVPLSEVFMRVYDKNEGKEAISHKASGEELKAAFVELVPDYDDERVYVSDIKKVFQWYNQLQENDMLEVIEAEDETSEEESASDEKSASKDEADKSKDSSKDPEETK